MGGEKTLGGCDFRCMKSKGAYIHSSCYEYETPRLCYCIIHPSEGCHCEMEEASSKNESNAVLLFPPYVLRV